MATFLSETEFKCKWLAFEKARYEIQTTIIDEICKMVFEIPDTAKYLNKNDKIETSWMLSDDLYEGGTIYKYVKLDCRITLNTVDESDIFNGVTTINKRYYINNIIIPTHYITPSNEVKEIVNYNLFGEFQYPDGTIYKNILSIGEMDCLSILYDLRKLYPNILNQ